MAEETALDAPITAVTVFRDGARVLRRGVATLQPGPRSVVIRGLPAAMDPASVRAAARGQELALRNVDVRRRFGADPLRDETARLRADAESRSDDVQALEDGEAAEQARLSFLGHLAETSAAALARALSIGRAGYPELARMADHLHADTERALTRRREIAARKRAARRELEAAEQRLEAAEKSAGRPVESAEVVVVLEAAAATTAELQLSYHVSGASWRPLYDLGLSGERLTVGYLAEVTQQTGEDWPEAELVLSTARRGSHQALPELRPWYIGRASVVHPPVRMAPRQLLSASSDDYTTPAPAFAGQAVAAHGQAAPAAPPVVAEPGESAVGLTYRVARPLAVPADGSPHKTTVASLEFDARLDHLTVPVSAPEAYLRATVTNDSPLLLLPGPARIFHDTQFVGETVLETVAAGEEFELQLGVDEQIRVERTLRRRGTSKAVIGNSRTIDIGYEITVENHRSGAARVSVHDHIPVSADADVRVRLREASPSPAEQDDLGELTWNLALDAGQQAAIRFRFTVEHPAQAFITGL